MGRDGLNWALRWVSASFLVCCVAHASAQTPELARARAAHESLADAKNEADRLALHSQLHELWEEALLAGGVLDADWGDWNNAVVALGEGKDKLVVFTWNVELDNRDQVYGGWMAHASEKADLGYEWSLLTHDDEVDATDTDRMYRQDQWQGGLYYKGLLTLDGATPVYTLLAWDGADAATTRKWVETVEPRNGRMRIGTPRIEVEGRVQKRMVLTYADAAQVTLTFEGEPMRVVMDHLAPMDRSFEGQFAFYGPSLSYDALEWDKNKWHFVSNIAVQNSEENSPREYRDPSRRRRRN